MIKYISFLILTTFLLSCNNNTTITFDNNKDVVKIPFEYSIKGIMTTKCIIKNDTLKFMFDTGSPGNLISKNIKGRKLIIDKTIQDYFNFTRTLSSYVVDSIKWGDMKINNFYALKDSLINTDYDGLLGRKIIKNMCVKIDNINHKIILSKDPDKIEKKGIERDFDSDKFAVRLTDEKKYKNKYFIFDTGFYGDLSVDSIYNNNTISTWKIQKKGLLKPYYSEKNITTYYFIHKLKWDTITYNNILYSYIKNSNRNHIGTSFIRRFKSITIDCINNKIYFEFPENKHSINFSSKIINDISAFPLDIIYENFISFGLYFHKKYPFTISKIKLNRMYSNIDIGDTLVGIDDMIFEQSTYDKLLDNHKYFIEKDNIKRNKKLSEVMHKRNNAIFHFIKNDTLLSLKVKRDSIINYLPDIAYCFNNNKKSLSYFSFIIDSKPNISLCIPNFIFSGKEIKITILKNGKEQTISNKID